MMNTYCKEIPETNGCYYINSSGDVMSRFPGKNLRILRPKTDKCGYKIVTLSLGGCKKSFYVHRLVALSFLGMLPGKPEINHINGVKSDNRLENLEWVQRSENMQHAYRIGLCKPIGQRVVDIKTGAVFSSIKEAAISIGINQGTCRNYLNGNIKHNPTGFRHAIPVNVYTLPIDWYNPGVVKDLDQWKTVWYA